MLLSEGNMKALVTLVRPSAPLLILPALHVILCVVVQLNPNEWQWFPVFVVDLPFSMLLRFLAFLKFLPPILIFGLFGTLWWYVVSLSIRFLYLKSKSTFQPS